MRKMYLLITSVFFLMSDAVMSSSWLDLDNIKLKNNLKKANLQNNLVCNRRLNYVDTFEIGLLIYSYIFPIGSDIYVYMYMYIHICN